MNHKLICYYTPLITDVFTSAKAGGYVSSGVCLSVSNFKRKYWSDLHENFTRDGRFELTRKSPLHF